MLFRSDTVRISFHKQSESAPLVRIAQDASNRGPRSQESRQLGEIYCYVLGIGDKAFAEHRQTETTLKFADVLVSSRPDDRPLDRNLHVSLSTSDSEWKVYVIETHSRWRQTSLGARAGIHFCHSQMERRLQTACL